MAVPSNVIFFWPSTNASIPAGWTRETTLDSKYIIGAPAATNPGTTGGSSTHVHTSPAHTHTGNSHTHTFSGGATADGGSETDFGATTLADIVHSHSSKTSNAATITNQNATVTLNSTSNDPPYYDVIYIKSGGTTDIPNSVLGFFNSSAVPSGWTEYAASQNRFFRGAAVGGNGGGTGGSSDSHTHTETASHNHTQDAHSHTSITSGTVTPTQPLNNVGSANTLSRSNHTHSVTFSSTTGVNLSASIIIQAADAQPVFRKLLVIQNTSGGASLPNGIIGIFLGTLASIPTNWKLCDGSLSTPDMRDSFPKAANGTGEIGNTGGSLAHSHTADPHTHTQTAHNHTGTGGAGSTTAITDLPSGGGGTGASGAISTHTHTWTINNTTPTNQNTTISVDTISSKAAYPPYVEVAFIQFQDPTVSVGQTIYRRVRVR